MLTEDKVLAFLETVGDLLKEGANDYRKYSNIGKEAGFRSMSDEELIDIMDNLDDENFMIAYKVLQERFPKLL